MDLRDHDPISLGDIGSPGEISMGIESLLAQILTELQRPLLRPKAQIQLRTNLATDTNTNIFSTHVRYHITRIVTSSPLSNAIDIVCGFNKPVEGIINGAQTAFLECDFIIDPGVDVQARTQGGAALAATAPVSVLLVGEIIN